MASFFSKAASLFDLISSRLEEHYNIRFVLCNFQYYASITGGSNIKDVLQALEPSFQKALSLRFPLGKIRLLQGAPDLVALFRNKELVQHLFPNNLFFAGLEPFEPTVENIPEIMDNNRRYALAIDQQSFSCVQFVDAAIGLVLRMKVSGEHLTSADVIAHIFAFLSLIPAYYREGKVAFGVSLPVKSLADEVEEQCQVFPFHDDRFPLDVEGVIDVRYVPVEELC